MNRIDLFEKALVDVRLAFAKAPHMFPLKSVIDQLEYLVDLEKGSAANIIDLETITIGQIAARDIDNFDPALAELLHEVSAQVRKMIKRL